MALFKTIDEIKNYLPVSITFEFSEILPFVKEAERDYIIPAIGKEQYNDLQTKYDASTLTSDDNNLLDYIRTCLAPFSYMLWIPWGQVQINSAGIQIVSTDNMKTAFQWQVNDLEKSALRSGFSALESLLEFLEENKVTYSIWARSSAYNDSKANFINSAAEFTASFGINCTRRTFNLIRPLMTQVENTVIKNTIGSDKFSSIKANILADNLSSDDNDYLELIQPALANITLQRSIGKMRVFVDELGISVLSSASQDRVVKKPADGDFITDLRMQCAKEGKDYLTQLQDKANAANNIDPVEGFTNDDTAGVGLF